MGLVESVQTVEIDTPLAFGLTRFFADYLQRMPTEELRVMHLGHEFEPSQLTNLVQLEIS